MDSDTIAEMRWTMADNPVTNAEYAAFVAAGGDPDWPGPCGADDVAAVRVDYPHAVAYCEWRSGVDGAECRLPTDAEWQAWADSLAADDPRRVVADDDVWEWTSSAWDGAPDTPAARRVVRGGSWGFDYLSARAACRSWDDPDDRHDYVGFRVVRAAPVSLTSGDPGSESDVPALLARIATLEVALPDPDKLDNLAEWMDIIDGMIDRARQVAPDVPAVRNYVGGGEIQRDLRTWASRIRALAPKGAT